MWSEKSVSEEVMVLWRYGVDIGCGEGTSRWDCAKGIR